MSFITCRKCGLEKTCTQATMVCRDCGSPANLDKHGEPLANLCRDCCPTGHGTRFLADLENLATPQLCKTFFGK